MLRSLDFTLAHLASPQPDRRTAESLCGFHGKTSLRIYLRSYDGPLNAEQLKRVVACSRDFFHTFVGTTLRRRYRRAVPIDLVDDWVVKARFGIVGRSMPRLNARRYAATWNQFFPAIRETYADYYGKATDTWLQAWENNNRDFGAFSGLVKLYSTNFAGIDWDKTLIEFEAGRISTGR